MEQIEMCITSRCNLSCKHCYQHFEKNKYELDKEKIINLINYAISRGTKTIILSGGEATLHPNYYEILNFLNNLNVDVTLVTNATLIKTELLKELSKDRFKFVISIDGNEKHHDERRGNGMYKKTLANLQKIKELGFKTKANITIDVNNYHDIPELLEINYFDEFSFMPVGYAGAAAMNNMTTYDEDFEKVVEYIYSISNDKCLKRHCSIYPKSISIKYNGDVFPCSLARDYGLLKMGNLYEKSIEEICNDFEKTNNYECVKSASTKKNIQKCNNCKVKNCYRGCRVRALKFFGDLNMPDPFSCKLNNQGFENISYSKIYWGEKQ